MVGRTLGHYEILEPLGKGGMGEVYRARDTHLDRDVAIKVLPEDFAADPGRLARFEREAKLLAQLNHANIATVHGLEDTDGIRFIAMEVVEGETLAERLAARGRFEIEEALDIVLQIAAALEAAHAKDVVHRDLKPANIKVTPEGNVKVLDFGLAKAYEAGGSPAEISPEISHSPTVAPSTRTGVIMGTAAYMSPEQAGGKAVDSRSDIWAFGCLLYEMLAGRKAYEGDSVSDTLARVLRDEPAYEALPATTPGAVKRLIRRCLAKKPGERLHHIADARIEIAEARDAGPDDLSNGRPPDARQRWQSRAAGWLVIGLIGATVGGSAVRLLGAGAWPGGGGRSGIVQLSIPLSSDAPIGLGGQPPLTIAISPNGSEVAFVVNRGGRNVLYRRLLSEGELREVPGSEGGQGPFYSPAGDSLGFFINGKLKIMRLASGVTVELAQAAAIRGTTVTAGGHAVYSTTINSGLWSVPVDGSEEPRLLLDFDPDAGEIGYRWPDALPNKNAVLFTIDTGESFTEARIGFLDIDSGEKSELLRGGTRAVYSPTGHVVFAREGNLLAAPFDAATGTLTGDATVVWEGVLTQADSGAAHFALSQNGVLAYIPGGAWTADRALVRIGPEGVVTPIGADIRAYQQPALSPDGNRLAVNIIEERHEILIVELSRGNILTRLTDEGDNHAPLWSPDGSRIAFSSERGGASQLFSRSADGVGEAQPLWSSPNGMIVPTSWSADGRFIAFTEIHRETRGDIWVLHLDDEPRAEALILTSNDEREGVFSPRGDQIAFVSNEDGRSEVYIRSFPETGPRTRVSTEGGRQPLWSADGSTLYYRSGDRMMAVAVEDGDPGSPVQLFEERLDEGYINHPRIYDVIPDGQGFYAAKSEANSEAYRIDIVLNFFDVLERLVPTGR